MSFVSSVVERLREWSGKKDGVDNEGEGVPEEQMDLIEEMMMMNDAGDILERSLLRKRKGWWRSEKMERQKFVVLLERLMISVPEIEHQPDQIVVESLRGPASSCQPFLECNLTSKMFKINKK